MFGLKTQVTNLTPDDEKTQKERAQRLVKWVNEKAAEIALTSANGNGKNGQHKNGDKPKPDAPEANGNGNGELVL